LAQLSATMCSRIAIFWVILVSFAAVTLCAASQRVFVIVYFVINSILVYCYCTLSMHPHYSTTLVV